VRIGPIELVKPLLDTIANWLELSGNCFAEIITDRNCRKYSAWEAFHAWLVWAYDSI